MPMTDEEYKRIVEEHKAAKNRPSESDFWAGWIDRMDRHPLKITLLQTSIWRIGHAAYKGNGRRKTGGIFDETIRRAEALEQRAGTIQPRDLLHETLMRISSTSDAVNLSSPTTDAAALDALLTRIETELAVAGLLQ